MKEYRVRVHSIGDVMGFVEAAKQLRGPCEVVSGRYRVDGKSLMGMLAIPETADMVLELGMEQDEGELPEGLLKYLWL